MPGDLGAFVWLGVVRDVYWRVFGRRLEEQADAGVGVAIAAVHGRGVADLVLG
jgi:hypothetical protein